MARLGCGLTLVLALLPAVWLNAHPGYYNTAIHAHDVDSAIRLARSEYKQIFVAITTPARDGWPVFRWPDPATRTLVDLLVRETVMVELTTEARLPGREASGEGLLLLDGEGSPRLELPLDTPAPVLERALLRILSSDAALSRIEGAIAALGADHFVSRERLARALQSAGRGEEALRHYAWCLDATLEGRSAAARARRPQVWGALAKLARRSEPAEALLERTRQRATARVLAAPEERQLAQDLAHLNGALGKQRENARLFDRLPTYARARHALLDPLLHTLVLAGRSREVLLLINPLEAWRGEVAIYRRNRIRRPASAERGSGRGSRSFVLARGTALARALAAQGDHERSEQLRRAVALFEQSSRAGTRLREAAGGPR